MPTMPVTYSAISPTALLKNIIPQFQIEEALHCEFWCQGLNDSYRVTTANQTFLLRIYRHNWRSLEAIKFEIEALLHLHDNDAKVAYPIQTRIDDDYIVSFLAPEGMRYAMMTPYIIGSEITLNCPHEAHLYGQHIAQIHLSSEHFSSQYTRPHFGSNHLIDEPLQRIKPFLKHRKDDWLFLTDYAKELSVVLQTLLATSHDIGLCHGDLNGGNAHHLTGVITSFDYDCCTIGLRIYDLAVCKWGLEQNNIDSTIWKACLQGYLKTRNLNSEEVLLIDKLVSIRHIWLMGLHIDIALAKGWLNDNYFTDKLAFLRQQVALDHP